ncbi:hypothetical protein [Psychromonas algicola]|nr:hypothetical protein [Psychromonas sp. RZ5]
MYLNLSKTVQKKWLTDVSGYLETAQENWDGIKGLTEEQIAQINN